MSSPRRISNFKVIAFAEGISFLVLILIAMPLKYLGNIPEAVKITGWIHGVLFMLYIPAVFWVRKAAQWNLLQVLAALAASVVPAGTFLLERKYMRKPAQN